MRSTGTVLLVGLALGACSPSTLDLGTDRDADAATRPDGVANDTATDTDAMRFDAVDAPADVVHDTGTDAATDADASDAPTTATVAIGSQHVCALRSTGEMDCWGENDHGEVGNGTTTPRVLHPTAVTGLADAVDLAASAYDSCARRVNGQVVCWGSAIALGNGSGAMVTMPAAPVTGLDDAVQISGGQHTFCARRADGHVVCWGLGGLGMLGNGALVDQTSPVEVLRVTDAVQVVVGDQHVCARRANGQLACWGLDDAGQLGDGVAHPAGAQFFGTPFDVMGVTDAIDVAAGENHTCAVRANGQVICWGENRLGELGDGTTTGRLTPVAVVGVTDARRVFAGVDTTCAIRGSGRVSCWGSDGNGELGNGTVGTVPQTTPSDVTGLTDATEMAMGDGAACARRATGALVCWGLNSSGQLGDGTVTNRSTPVQVGF